MSAKAKKSTFLFGLFLSAGVILALQILHTRILSIASWYFLAFFAISMAMFGMTAGALIVYFLPDKFGPQAFRRRLAQIGVAFAASIFVSWLFLISSPTTTEFAAPVMAALIWLKLVFILALPYVAGGMLISVALTRSPYPIGEVYAVDLIGAAAGCFFVLGLMNVMDGVSAILAVAAIAGLAAIAFSLFSPNAGTEPSMRGSARRIGLTAVAVTVLLGLLTWFNSSVYPYGARLLMQKGQVAWIQDIGARYWNSFSRVDVSEPAQNPPFFWGPSPKAAALGPIEQRFMVIDGEAGTPMYRFDGNRDDLAFLRYDITNLAYAAKQSGAAAVIGVGGGRDLLAAYYFGFEDITGVEINPIFVENLEDRYAAFSQIAALPEVTLVNDEARSWFARTGRRFDLIQMSLIDTWAATGVGAFSLSENGLYTIEGWETFLDRLKPDGMFTVSRWYSPRRLGETGKMVALAKAALLRQGVAAPNAHIFLAGTDNLATIVVTRQPLTETELADLRAATNELGFNVILAPGLTPTNEILGQIHAATSVAQINADSRASRLDFSPPDDSSPFFFNQLHLTQLPELIANRDEADEGGVMQGNLIAAGVLLIIIAASGGAVILTVLLPTLPALSRVSRRLSLLGSLYFLLIGLGFMFVEIALMQRLSIFLGHPVYGLAIALAGIILATGIGSYLSELFPLDTAARLLVWLALAVAYLSGIAFVLPAIIEIFAASNIFVRGLASLLAVLPAGIALGFGFPTGMRLVSAMDDRPTPWFWAVNGAAGVFASGLAVAVATFASINVNFAIGALCYALLLPIALLLRRLPASAGARAAGGEPVAGRAV